MRAALLLFLLASGLAHAGQVCASPAENHRRLAFIQTHLHEDARRARVWTGAWGAGYGALALVQFAATAALPDQLPDLYVGAISSAGALAALLVVPLDVMEDSHALDALALAHPSEVDCDVLAETERLLVHSAENERAGRSLFMHGANIVYNALSLLVLGLVFDRWASGALNALVGIALGEAQILTQPTGAEETLRRYRSGEWDAAGATPRPAWNVQVAVASSRTGLQLRISF